MHVRYCVACGEEFRPEIVSCSDCGALLEDRYEGEGGAPQVPDAESGEADAAAEPSLTDYVQVLNAADSAAIRRGAVCLTRDGIHFRVRGDAHGYDLLVLWEDQEAAIVALEGRPGAVSLTPLDEASATGVCPGCGSAVAAGVLECPECGLLVGSEPEEE